MSVGGMSSLLLVCGWWVARPHTFVMHCGPLFRDRTLTAFCTEDRVFGRVAQVNWNRMQHSTTNSISNMTPTRSRLRVPPNPRHSS
ncbi:hypothetical protein BDN67DRAFT_259920 [Paxillus ammoniavirescens]|nr:hypothetical protein BDN67DRAFT_259920 [Paxillus ammoniavirescens]